MPERGSNVSRSADATDESLPVDGGSDNKDAVTETIDAGNEQTVRKSQYDLDRVKSVLSKARDYLKSQQLPDGSWPYKAGNRDASLEATAWVSLALKGETNLIEKVFQFYLAAQNEDGGFSTAPNMGNSSWITGPVVLSMRNLKSDIREPLLSNEVDKALDRALTYMCESRVEFYPVVARLLLLISKGPDSLRYARGWPWDKQCFHWVEPTSYNLLALKTSGVPPSHAGYFAEISDIAEKFIMEHSCEGGGWNHGNNRTLGADLPPYRVTTAEALLAVQEFKDKPQVQAALKYLQSLSDQDTSSMSLAWSCLALNAYDRDHSKELGFLLNRQKENGSFGDNMMVDGLACLALESVSNNLLKYSGAAS